MRIFMKKKNLIKIISFIIVSGIILLVFYHCPFLYFFGIPCPGCGMTRALISAAKLDFNAAFYYHPLFFLVILAAIYIALKLSGKIKISKKTENRLIMVVCILFIAVYFIRLFAGSEVVKTDFENSVLYKIKIIVQQPKMC